MELVCRFLRRASANLAVPISIKLPSSDSNVPVTERKRILSELLVEFIRSYNQETDELMTQPEVSINSGIVTRTEFDLFRAYASEQSVEDILTTYTHENKSASVFLGAKK